MAFYCYEKEKLQMSSKYIFIKGFLLIREMPIKTTLTFYLAPVRMTVIKNPKTGNAHEDMWKEEASGTDVGENAN